MYWVSVIFVEIDSVKVITWLRKCIYIRNVDIYCPMCVKFGVIDLSIMLLGTCEFRENRHREGRTPLTCVNEITFTHVLLKRTIFSN
jgi:hypothetical protein